MTTKLLYYGILVSSTSIAAPPQIKHDPFKKPEQTQPPFLQVGDKSTLPDSLVEMTLSSTLQSGKNSMVIINGTTIKLGERLNGLKLIEVNERSAVFSNGHQLIRLTLDEK